MPVTLSIRNVPNKVAARLRARAKANHRSLQGELLATVTAIGDGEERQKTVAEAAAAVRKLDLPRPRHNESTDMIRKDRDSR